jgi:hypothetical protein
MVVFVKSSRSNFSGRNIQRLSHEMLASAESQMYFVLGTGSTFIEEINVESEKYHDILIADFLDCYENLALKTQFAYQFGTDFCSKSAKFILQATG